MDKLNFHNKNISERSLFSLLSGNCLIRGIKKKKRGSKSLTLTEVERALLLTSAKTLTESMIVEMQEKYAAL